MTQILVWSLGELLLSVHSLQIRFSSESRCSVSQDLPRLTVSHTVTLTASSLPAYIGVGWTQGARTT